MNFPTIARRDALRTAAGLGLSFLLPALDSRAAEQRGTERRKSLILLWMGGGPSQLETWDPHAGSKIGGETKAIKTKKSGLEIAEFFPRMAEEIHELNVIRSLVSKEGDHERGTYFVKTGYRPDPTLTHPALGAVLTHEFENPQLEIPDHVSLGGSQWPGRGGYLGDKYDAFRVFDPGRNVQNMRARVGQDRQDLRNKNLATIGKTFSERRRFASRRTLHAEMMKRAQVMMNSKQLKAFDIDGESRQTLENYGDSQFGRGCLVARRLVEQGVRAVEVNLTGFDSHANNFEVHKRLAGELDPAFSTLIRDLKQCDLLQSTLVLCIGEFGRTPRINPLDGRDHWPTGFSCVVGGGGLAGGVVIGETDPTGERRQPNDPVRLEDLYATIFNSLGVDFQKELSTPIGRPMAISHGKPLRRLLPS